MTIKHSPETELLKRVFDHWDAQEELCDTCRVWWMARTNAFRKEARHTYEVEDDA